MFYDVLDKFKDFKGFKESELFKNIEGVVKDFW